jgi:sulfur carrier protein
MITIYFNVEKIILEKSISLAELLEKQKMETIYFATAVNRVFIPRSQYQHTQLQQDDHVEIILPMQGG